MKSHANSPFFLKPTALAALIAASVSGHVLAQAAPDAGALQRSLEQQIQRGAPNAEFPAVKAPESKSKEIKSSQSITIHSIEFTGNTAFSKEQLDKVVAPWVGKTIPFSDLKDITTAIQELYGHGGRIAQALIPPQQIKGGVLRIQIIEGRLGKISVSAVDEKMSLRYPLERSQKYMESGNPVGELINTDQVDRSLALLNEVPGVGATAFFSEGREAGTSDLNVKVNEGPLVSGRVEAANYGSTSTGAWQGVGNLALNNLSGYGDLLSIDAIQSLGSSFIQGAYTLPIGYNGWKVGAIANFLNYQTLSSYSTTQTTGQATTFGLNAAYALVRTATSNSSLNFALLNRDYRNSVPYQTLSDYQINNLNAGITGNELLGGGVLGYGVTASLGNLYMNNANQKAQDQAGPNTAGSYFKLNGNVSQNQPLPISNTSLVGTLSGQWANKNLNSADDFYLGGPYGIRAYPVAQGGGARGALATLELQHNFTSNWQGSVFVDGGMVQQWVTTYPGWQGLTNANNNYLLGGYGLGGKYTEQQYNVSLMAAHTIGQNPLFSSAGQQVNVNNSNRNYEVWVKGTLFF